MIRVRRPERPRVEGYAEIAAESRRSQAADRLAARKADNRAQGGGRREASRSIGWPATRDRMVHLAESSPHDQAARDALPGP